MNLPNIKTNPLLNYLLIITFCLFSFYGYAQVGFVNPSFEGPVGTGVTPDPWTVCPGGSTDTQPGADWGITLPASHGSTYLGFWGGGVLLLVSLPPEGTSQQLSCPLIAGRTYSFDIDIAVDLGPSASYSAGELEIYASNTDCDKTNLITSVTPSVPNVWETTTITFTAAANYDYISFYCSDVNDTYILLDNIQEVFQVPDEITVVTDPSCPGDSDGSAFIEMGGATNFQFDWGIAGNVETPGSNSTISTHNSLSAGTYNVTITDPAQPTSCFEVVVPITISDPPAISVAVSSTDETGCNADGTITLNFTNGQPSFSADMDDGTSTINVTGNPISLTGLSAGTYTFTNIMDANGCPLPDEVVTIAPGGTPMDVDESANLCSGETYTSPTTGTDYTTSGTETFTDLNGCEATLTVTITELTPMDIDESANLCSGETYTSPTTGTDYTTSGTETFTDLNGCEATLTVTITELTPMDIDESANLCSGETYTSPTTGTDYTTSGTETFTDLNGCEATLTVTIMEQTPMDVDESANLCSGETYTSPTTGTDYTTSGTETFTDLNGCEATLTVTITEQTPMDVDESANLCSGETYTSPTTGTDYTTSGTETFTDLNGCEATLTVTITEQTPMDVDESANLCSGETYTSPTTGTDYTTSGTETFTDLNGCEATLTVTITELTPMDVDESANLCAGETYTSPTTGTDYTTSGTETFTDLNGCEATLTVTITELTPMDVDESANLCAGETYTSPTTGTDYTTSGTETFTDLNGCEATLTVTITEQTPMDVDESADLCSGETYTSPTTGTDYTTSGTETFTDLNGCEATLTVTITEQTPEDPTFTINNTYCAGEDTDVLPTTSNNGIAGTWVPDVIDNMVGGDYVFTPAATECANPFTLAVTIDAREDPIFNITETYCAGENTDALPLTSNNGIAGTWSPANINNMTSDTYTFTPASAECANPFVLNVTINQPTDPTFNITTTYCVGDAGDVLSTTSDNGIAGTWMPATISTASAGNTSYIFTPDMGCFSDFTLSVTVNDCGCMDPAMIMAMDDFSICEGETADLSATIGGSATSITWTTAGDGTFDDDSNAAPVYTPGANDIANGSVTVTVTTDDPDGAGPCSASSDDVVITIDSMTDPTFTLTDTYCEGETTDVLPTTSENGITGTWTPATIDNAADGVYTFIPDAGACANSFTLNVTIETPTDPTFVITDTYCIDDAADVLPTTSENGITGTWTPATITTSTAGNTDYTFTPDMGCFNPYTISILVEDCGCATPATVTAIDNLAICENETADLSATLGGSATSITWTTAGDGTFDDDTNAAPVYTLGANDIANGSVTVTVTTDDPDGAGPCSASSDDVVITINAPVDPTFVITNSYCEGETTDVLPTTSENGITGTWTPATIDNAADGVYTFIPDAGACANSFTLNVTIETPTDPTFVIVDAYCIDDASDALPTTSDNGITGTWTPATITTSTAGNTDYTFTPDMGCFNLYTISILVEDCGCATPATVAAIDNFAICENETADLSATLGGSATSITWTTAGDGTFDDDSNAASVYTPGANDIASGSVTVTVTTDDPDGAGPCSASSDDVVITINSMTDPTFTLTHTYCEGATTDALPTTSDNGVTGSWVPSTINNMTSGIYTFTPDADVCANEFTLNVTIETPTDPTFVITDTYCIDDAADVLPTTSDNGITGTWTPATITTSTAGNTDYTFTPDMGCFNPYTISILVEDCGCPTPATVAAIADFAICEGGTADLSATLGGSATSLTWTTAGDGTYDDDTNANAVYTPGANDITNGSVTVTVTTDDPDGAGPCSASSDDVVITINSMTDPTFTLTDNYCEGETTDVLPTTSENGITGIWTPNAISNTADGTYTFMPSANECANSFTINVTIKDAPVVANITEMCDQDGETYTVSFTISDGDANTYTVIGDNGTLVGNTFTSDPIADNTPYTFVVNDVNNCSPTTVSGQFDCPDCPAITFNLTVSADISCFGEADGIALVSDISSNTQPITFNWSNGDQNQEAESLLAGWQVVTVTDGDGCFGVDSIFLSEPAALSAQLIANDSPCFGDDNGSILFDIIIGGTGPYSYSIDGENFVNQNQFNYLSPGVYNIAVEDANGCMFEEDLSILEPDEILLNLGLDTILNLGDSILLDPNYNLIVVDSFIWLGVDCINCPEVMVTPTEASTISLSIESLNGCLASDAVVLFVNTQTQVFLPNVFSPNGDGNNDLFYPQAGAGVEKINQFQVFDRWGEKVFEYYDFPPNDATFGWDGWLNGKPLNPQVFVWFVEVELKNGRKEIFKGDVIIVK